jgi:hypothetical protein
VIRFPHGVGNAFAANSSEIMDAKQAPYAKDAYASFAIHEDVKTICH